MHALSTADRSSVFCHLLLNQCTYCSHRQMEAQRRGRSKFRQTNNCHPPPPLLCASLSCNCGRLRDEARRLHLLRRRSIPSAVYRRPSTLRATSSGGAGPCNFFNTARLDRHTAKSRPPCNFRSETLFSAASRRRTRSGACCAEPARGHRIVIKMR